VRLSLLLLQAGAILRAEIYGIELPPWAKVGAGLSAVYNKLIIEPGARPLPQ
jgi:hypothetical protein